MSETEKIEALNKIYNSKTAYTPIDQKSQIIKDIYKEMLTSILEKANIPKIKVENIRISRQNIKAYLEKRYNQR